MSEQQNKPKIDLRARLGKKTVGTAGPSIPPPMATGASIPAPPFVAKSIPPQAVLEPERPRFIEPQAIKIEMSDEMVEAQKKGKSKIITLAVVAAVVGAGIGFALGSGVEKGKKHTIALQGAELLGKDVDKANAEIDKIDELLKKIKLRLSDGEFPEAEINSLSEVSVPFDTSYLLGKGTNLMSAKVNDMLLSFSSQAVEANELKDTVQSKLNSLRKDFDQSVKDSKSPRFYWSIYVANGPHGPMASMQKFTEPFAVSDKEAKDYKWPEEVEVPEGDKKVKLKLYKDGNPINSSPLLIPVDPASPGTSMLNDFTVKYYELRQEIDDLEKTLKGDRSDPTNEKTGLVDLGRGLIDELKQIGMAS